MPPKQIQPLTPYPVTAEERKVINLMRAANVTEEELVVVPQAYINMLKASVVSMKASMAQAQTAISVAEYLIDVSVPDPVIE